MLHLLKLANQNVCSQEMQDVLDEDSDMGDWLIRDRDSKMGVVLHDRLMTEALGGAPIKTEHSYSLHSDVESEPSSPNHTKVDGKITLR